MNTTNQNTALLVMDMQVAIISKLPSENEIVGKVTEAIAHARTNHIPVIYVVVGFRPGMPEVSPNNKAFTASKERMGTGNTNEFMTIDAAVAPLPNEIVVTKRRYSAFTGSDLEVILRAQGIQHLVLTGVSTSGVVLSTVREATDKDYRLTVLSDGCTDGDQEVHGVLTRKVFPRQADVMTVEEWIKIYSVSKD
jgi:nicotinamidase-related amidase